MEAKARLTGMGRVYVAATTVVGMLIVLHSLARMATQPVQLEWFILAGLTLLSGSFTVRIPTTSARLSVSEIFVFAAALLFGAAAATLIVVLDVLVVSLWRARVYSAERVERVLFNAAAASVAIWTASHAFFLITGLAPLFLKPKPIIEIVPGLVALATIYFLLNSFLIAWAIGFQQRVSPFSIWRRNFLWLSLNYFSGASVAVLLLPYLYRADHSGFALAIGVLIPILLISYLTFRTALGRVDDANRHLTELNKLYLSTIETLAMAIDAKDQITHGHIRRVQTYAVGLARRMGVTDEALIKAIEAAALLHDMGKLAVPEYILNKPGPLTPAEFEKMKLHASVGADILSAIDFPYPVVPIVRHHHESWDGSGYPNGLKGADIPIGARILSVVDCFDALTSDRPYRPRLADKDALRILAERRGTMYDPLVVDMFAKVHAEIAPDTPAEPPQSFVAITDAASTPHAQLVTKTQPLEDISASSEEMLTLFTLAGELTGGMTTADLGDVLFKHLKRLVPSSLAVFFVYDDSTADVVALHVCGERGDAVKDIRIPVGQRLSGWVAANRQSIRNSDPVLDFGDIARTMRPRPRSCLSTPLVAGEKIVGVLSLYSPGVDSYTEEHQRLVEIMARQVSPVLQRSLDHAVEPGGMRDPLTSLPYLQQLQRLENEQTRLDDLPTPSALIYLDASALKQMNAGDQGLRNILQVLRLSLRTADLLFRLEGDEFATLFVETDRRMVEVIAARVHMRLQQLSISQTGRKPVVIDLAIATAPEDGTRIESLVESARARLSQKFKPQSSRNSRNPDSIH